MAKKKSSDEMVIGTRVRMRPGTTVPEFPEVNCGGWTGSIVDATGKQPNTKYVIEWDDATLAVMPDQYVRACEAKGLLHRMACFDAAAFERGP